MKKLQLLLFLLVNVCIIAQESASILGVATDLDSGEAILFATVVLYQNDVLVRGTETDFDGVYKFEGLSPGVYDIEINYLGLKDVRKSNQYIESGDNFIDFEMEEDDILLPEVVISAYGGPCATCCVLICCGAIINDYDDSDIVITTILNYDKPSYEESALVYPNPATTQISATNEMGASAIFIVNAMGQQVYSKNNLE